MGKNEIEQFLTYLATQKNINPTTQNQVFNTILFLYGASLRYFTKQRES